MMRHERNRQLVNKSSRKVWKLTGALLATAAVGAFVDSESAQVTVHAATHSSAVKVDEATVEDQKVSLNGAVAPEEAIEEVEYEEAEPEEATEEVENEEEAEPEEVTEEVENEEEAEPEEATEEVENEEEAEPEEATEEVENEEEAEPEEATEEVENEEEAEPEEATEEVENEEEAEPEEATEEVENEEEAEPEEATEEVENEEEAEPEEATEEVENEEEAEPEEATEEVENEEEAEPEEATEEVENEEEAEPEEATEEVENEEEAEPEEATEEVENEEEAEPEEATEEVENEEEAKPEEATEEVENTNTSEKVESEVPSVGQELHANLSVSEYEKAVADAAFDALNRLRAENGLDPLQRDDALEATSESRASDVAGTDTNGELHHVVGGTAANAKAHGYTGESNDLVVENLACYSQSGEDFVSYVDPKQLGEDFVNQFYAERGFPDGNHRFNMLNPNFTRAGIGVKVEGNKVVMSQHISLQDSDLDYDKYKEYADWTDTHNVQSDDRTRGLDSLDDFLSRRSGANSYQYDAHK